MFVEKHACEADGKSWFPTRRGLESSTASQAVLQNAGSGCPLVVERQKYLKIQFLLFLMLLSLIFLPLFSLPLTPC